jgi:hypothetical protein
MDDSVLPADREHPKVTRSSVADAREEKLCEGPLGTSAFGSSNLPVPTIRSTTCIPAKL